MEAMVNGYVARRAKHLLDFDSFSRHECQDLNVPDPGYRWRIWCRGKYLECSSQGRDAFINYCRNLYEKQFDTRFADLVFPDLIEFVNTKPKGVKLVRRDPDGKYRDVNEPTPENTINPDLPTADLRRVRDMQYWHNYKGAQSLSIVTNRWNVFYYGTRFRCDQKTLDAWNRWIQGWLRESVGFVVNVPDVKQFPQYQELEIIN